MGGPREIGRPSLRASRVQEVLLEDWEGLGAPIESGEKSWEALPEDR